jgi:tetratricopeptide (TPR) repeat protein
MLYRHRGHRYISVREFDKAVTDLNRAAEFNDHDFDIWYHLGLAHYLLGEFEKALPAYEKCLAAAEDDDSKIAISNWLNITLRRLGKRAEADALLAGITEGMNVVENQSYDDLYKGLKPAAEIESRAAASDLDLATTGYGIGGWYLTKGDTEKAFEIFRKIIETKYWPAFGYIAAEAELARTAVKR